MDPFRLACTGIDPVAGGEGDVIHVAGNVIHVAGITQKRNTV